MTLFRHVVGDREVVGPLMEDRPVGSHCLPYRGGGEHRTFQAAPPYNPLYLLGRYRSWMNERKLVVCCSMEIEVEGGDRLEFWPLLRAFNGHRRME